VTGKPRVPAQLGSSRCLPVQTWKLIADRGVTRRMSWDLATIKFPFMYGIGAPLGNTEFEHWRVPAWIAATERVDQGLPATSCNPVRRLELQGAAMSAVPHH
jgi:hypothetical protein